jgi:flagellar biosynthesis component FlhA
LGAGAWWLNRRAKRALQTPAATAPAPAPVNADQKELSWDDVQPVDQIGLEVGFRLVRLVDKGQGGELLARIRGVRRKLSQELGFLVQSVHIRDNLELAPNAYRISLAGVSIADGMVTRTENSRSIPVGYSANHQALRRAIRPSEWKRSGSSPPSVNTRRHWATRWLTRAP